MTTSASRQREVLAVEQTPKGVVERSCTTSIYVDEYVAEVELRGEDVVLYVGSAKPSLLANGSTISLAPANARHLAMRLIALAEEGATCTDPSHETDPCGLTGFLIAPRPPEGGAA